MRFFNKRLSFVVALLSVGLFVPAILALSASSNTELGHYSVYRMISSQDLSSAYKFTIALSSNRGPIYLERLQLFLSTTSYYPSIGLVSVNIDGAGELAFWSEPFGPLKTLLVLQNGQFVTDLPQCSNMPSCYSELVTRIESRSLVNVTAIDPLDNSAIVASLGSPSIQFTFDSLAADGKILLVPNGVTLVAIATLLAPNGAAPSLGFTVSVNTVTT